VALDGAVTSASRPIVTAMNRLWRVEDSCLPGRHSVLLKTCGFYIVCGLGLGGLKEVGGYRRLWEKSGCCHIVEAAGVRSFDFAARSSDGRSERAPRRRQRLTQMQRHFQILDLKFEIRETANANAEANSKAEAEPRAKATANADPSPLKGIRDDNGWNFFSE
jgi:hypothetical protein